MHPHHLDDVEQEKRTFYFFASVRGRQRGRRLNSRPMRSVVVILVKHILPRVAAVQNVVEIPPMEARAVLGIATVTIKAGREASKQ